MDSILKNFTAAIVCILFSSALGAQITNVDVIAKIKTDKVLDLITITGSVENKTQLIKSLRYTMYVYKKNPTSNNVSKNEQSGRFVLKPSERKDLSETTINQNTDDKVTILLMVYDLDNNLIAKDRLVVLNDDEEKKKVIKLQEVPTETEFAGGFRGIVIEDTKTKPGRDFYLDFYSNYRLKEINGKEVVKISEQFSFGVNTIMEVSVGGTLVYKFFMQPTRDFIEAQADQAIIAVSRKLLALETQKNQIKQF